MERYSYYSDSSGSLGFVMLCYGIVALVYCFGVWRVAEKAGRNGCLALIPIVNYFVLADIAGLEWYFGFAMLIPGVNVLALLYLSLRLAKAFGKGDIYGILLGFFFPIGICVLGFSDAQYGGVGYDKEKPKRKNDQFSDDLDWRKP